MTYGERVAELAETRDLAKLLRAMNDEDAAIRNLARRCYVEQTRERDPWPLPSLR